MHTSTPPLKLDDYFIQAKQSFQLTINPDDIEKLKFGLFGEIGGLLSALKKARRDSIYEPEAEIAKEEIGDAIWYLLMVSHSIGIPPTEIANQAMKALRHYFKESISDYQPIECFRKIDAIISLHHDEISEKRSEILSKLALLTGSLVAFQHSSQDLFKHAPSELIGDILCHLSLCASLFGISIEETARSNLSKIIRRWPASRNNYYPLFDADFPDHEQLPRQLNVKFEERNDRHVAISINGVFIGDRVNDNSNDEDDYRFHDIFHLSYMAYLGWSPVIRALLKRKRKSNPLIDENEDGARAIIIEEAISAWIFTYAKRLNYFEQVNIGKIEYGLLKNISSLVNGLEVAHCHLWQWELAILEGFKTFREIKRSPARSGVISVDMIEHSIDFIPAT